MDTFFIKNNNNYITIEEQVVKDVCAFLYYNMLYIIFCHFHEGYKNDEYVVYLDLTLNTHL